MSPQARWLQRWNQLHSWVVGRRTWNRMGAERAVDTYEKVCRHDKYVWIRAFVYIGSNSTSHDTVYTVDSRQYRVMLSFGQSVWKRTRRWIRIVIVSGSGPHRAHKSVKLTTLLIVTVRKGATVEIANSLSKCEAYQRWIRQVMELSLSGSVQFWLEVLVGMVFLVAEGMLENVNVY